MSLLQMILHYYLQWRSCFTVFPMVSGEQKDFHWHEELPDVCGNTSSRHSHYSDFHVIIPRKLPWWEKSPVNASPTLMVPYNQSLVVTINANLCFPSYSSKNWPSTVNEQGRQRGQQTWLGTCVAALDLHRTIPYVLDKAHPTFWMKTLSAKPTSL